MPVEPNLAVGGPVEPESTFPLEGSGYWVKNRVLPNARFFLECRQRMTNQVILQPILYPLVRPLDCVISHLTSPENIQPNSAQYPN